jgi:hypothetical protein
MRIPRPAKAIARSPITTKSVLSKIMAAIFYKFSVLLQLNLSKNTKHTENFMVYRITIFMMNCDKMEYNSEKNIKKRGAWLILLNKIQRFDKKNVTQ